jgi:glyoxalase-like protein
MAATLDHLVVTAPNLKSGVQWVRDRLGATPELGGKHPRMGTHNCLLQLGEKAYLEVIAPDPNAPDPGRARWFELDQHLPRSVPQLAAWVARTSDIAQAVQSASEPLGPVEPMARGDLNWQITLTEDGALPLGGVAPFLIQWHTSEHPAGGLRDSGCTLLQLDLYHPDHLRAERLLASVGFDGNKLRLHPGAASTGPRIVATIDTPHGVKVLPAG